MMWFSNNYDYHEIIWELLLGMTPFLDVSENDRNVIRDWYEFFYNLHSNNGMWGGNYLIEK